MRAHKRANLYLLAFAILLAFPGYASASPDFIMGGDAVIPISSSGYDRALTLAYSPDGDLLAVGASSGIYLLDGRSNAQIRYIQTGTWVRSIAFSPDGRLLAAGLYDHTVRTWRMPQGEQIAVFSGHQGRVRSVVFSPGGETLVSAADDDTVRFWRVEDGTQAGILNLDGRGVRVIAYSPSGDILATGSADGHIEFWHPHNLSLLNTLIGHTDWVRSLSFSPDGKILASGSFDQKVRLWRVEDGSSLAVLHGHSASVLGVAFSSDGTILASSSVDTSLRVWQMADNSLLRILNGHNGFVYSVAFAPDGNTLASGSEDNTIHIWDLSAQVDVPGVSKPAGSGDCRSCHHPSGLVKPPRVMELRCEACHVGGVGFNWCPFFPSTAHSELRSFYESGRPAGVPTAAGNLAVVLASPSNGEILYTNERYIVPAIVAGLVYYTGDASQVSLQMEIWSSSKLVKALQGHPSVDGTFRFEMDINAEGSLPVPVKPSGKECAYCHEDYEGLDALPSGEVRLRIIATAPDGTEATDERWFTVDVSNRAPVRVRVSDAESGRPLAGAPVRAETILYNWRERYAGGSTAADGTVDLTLEVLNEEETRYRFTVQEMVVDGVLYEGADPVEVTIPPGEASIPDIHLSARARKGTITGQVLDSNGNSTPGATVWAVKQPGGQVYQAVTDESGHFTFSNLDVTRYEVVASGAPGQEGTQASSTVDLRESTPAEANLTLLDPPPHSFLALDERGKQLPFSWITVEGEGDPIASDPLSGRVLLDRSLSSPEVMILSSPGYYSQVFRFAPEVNPSIVSLPLKKHPDTRLVAWGKGQLTIPAQTEAQVSRSEIRLARGWLWGEGSGGAPLSIQTPGGRIEIPAGRFALESYPGGETWLYLYEGEGVVSLQDSSRTVAISAGQMLRLNAGGQPLPFVGELAAALRRPVLDDRIQIFEPGIKARITNGLSRLGIQTAQGVTFVTYILVFLSIAAVPLVGLYWFVRRRIG